LLGAHAMKLPKSFPWLESLIVLCAVMLVMQIFPVLWQQSLAAGSWMLSQLIAVVDVRNWTWGVWVTVESLVVVALVGIKAWKSR